MSTNYGRLCEAQWKTKYSTLGLHYGYPVCCINLFLARAEALFDRKEFRHFGMEPFVHNLKATGYMMCPECQKKPREQLIDEINRNRNPVERRFPL